MHQNLSKIDLFISRSKNVEFSICVIAISFSSYWMWGDHCQSWVRCWISRFIPNTWPYEFYDLARFGACFLISERNLYRSRVTALLLIDIYFIVLLFFFLRKGNYSWFVYFNRFSFLKIFRFPLFTVYHFQPGISDIWHFSDWNFWVLNKICQMLKFTASIAYIYIYIKKKEVL